MSRRNAEAGAPAAARRARRRLTASLGPASGRDGSDGHGADAASGQGMLERGLLEQGLVEQGNGAAGGRPFRYDGGAQPTSEEADPPSGGGTHGPSRLRWRTGLRVAVLLGLASLLVGGWFWWDVAASSPHAVPLSEASSGEARGQPEEGSAGPPGEAGSAGAQASAGLPGAKIVVHVAGAVSRTGVVELPAGSRIHEAIAAAGGSAAGADLNRLNLAAVLADGQKIHVPLMGEPDATGAAPVDGGAGSGDPGPGGDRIDLNSASVEELGALPRVGPVLAQRIVDWRKEHGRFSTVEELDAVDGVGPKMLETLLPLVRVS